jgi:hypothetical protein
MKNLAELEQLKNQAAEVYIDAYDKFSKANVNNTKKNTYFDDAVINGLDIAIDKILTKIIDDVA